ncbi:uncharacterized protein LOC116036069 [Sander lucioperca]|uniref:uncharacterized protein LOC116036069 n=1 Tax=Sander lucioperca TaxID=283035 RepID=UPI00125E38F9|nr:uncharacterized protein LOC116036069 [Sander lucioperca]
MRLSIRIKLLLSSLFLASLRARSSGSVSSGTHVVTQTTDVSVTEGGAVNITCCWTRQLGRVGVNWLKNHINEIINETAIIQTEIFSWKNHSQGSLQKETSNCSHLILTNVTREDSGRYICKVVVEIPSLNVVSGDGTVITVRDNTSTKNNTAEGSQREEVEGRKEVFIYIYRCLPIIFPVICFLFFYIFFYKAHTPAAAGDKVTGENQEEEEMDEINTEAE